MRGWRYASTSPGVARGLCSWPPPRGKRRVGRQRTTRSSAGTSTPTGGLRKALSCRSIRSHSEFCDLGLLRHGDPVPPELRVGSARPGPRRGHQAVPLAPPRPFLCGLRLRCRGRTRRLSFGGSLPLGAPPGSRPLRRFALRPRGHGSTRRAGLRRPGLLPYRPGPYALTSREGSSPPGLESEVDLLAPAPLPRRRVNSAWRRYFETTARSLPAITALIERYTRQLGEQRLR